jgi:hypothetical protein
MVLTFLLYIHTALIFSVINVAWIDLIHELGISYTFVGLISVFGAGFSMISMLLGGSIVGRFGARKTLTVTIPILVISHASLAFAPSQLMLFAVNVGWGVGFGAMLVACTTVIIDWGTGAPQTHHRPIPGIVEHCIDCGSTARWLFVEHWLDIYFGDVVSQSDQYPDLGARLYLPNSLGQGRRIIWASLRSDAGNRTISRISTTRIHDCCRHFFAKRWPKPGRPFISTLSGANPFISGAALAGFQSATALFRLINGLISYPAWRPHRLDGGCDYHDWCGEYADFEP